MSRAPHSKIQELKDKPGIHESLVVQFPCAVGGSAFAEVLFRQVQDRAAHQYQAGLRILYLPKGSEALAPAMDGAELTLTVHKRQAWIQLNEQAAMPADAVGRDVLPLMVYLLLARAADDWPQTLLCTVESDQNQWEKWAILSGLPGLSVLEAALALHSPVDALQAHLSSLQAMSEHLSEQTAHAMVLKAKLAQRTQYVIEGHKRIKHTSARLWVLRMISPVLGAMALLFVLTVLMLLFKPN